MTQDNDPWGNNPRNTESNELSSLLSKLKDSFFGGGGDNHNRPGDKGMYQSPPLPY